MVVPTPPIAQQALRTTDGRVYAYIVPADELDRLRAEAETLRAQVATLQRQKDRYAADFERLLKSSIPLPPTEAELQEAAADPNGFGNLIAGLEARQERK